MGLKKMEDPELDQIGKGGVDYKIEWKKKAAMPMPPIEDIAEASSREHSLFIKAHLAEAGVEGGDKEEPTKRK